MIRYDIDSDGFADYGIVVSADGAYVLYADCENELAALRAENARLREVMGDIATMTHGETYAFRLARAALSSQAPEAEGEAHSKSEQRRIDIQQEAKGESRKKRVDGEALLKDLYTLITDHDEEEFGYPCKCERCTELRKVAAKHDSDARKPAEEQKI